MNKNLLRLVSALLVPCLLVDPSTAAGLSALITPTSLRIPPLQNVERFPEEALEETLVFAHIPVLACALQGRHPVIDYIQQTKDLASHATTLLHSHFIAAALHSRGLSHAVMLLLMATPFAIQMVSARKKGPEKPQPHSEAPPESAKTTVDWGEEMQRFREIGQRLRQGDSDSAVALIEDFRAFLYDFKKKEYSGLRKGLMHRLNRLDALVDANLPAMPNDLGVLLKLFGLEDNEVRLAYRRYSGRLRPHAAELKEAIALVRRYNSYGHKVNRAILTRTLNSMSRPDSLPVLLQAELYRATPEMEKKDSLLQKLLLEANLPPPSKGSAKKALIATIGRMDRKTLSEKEEFLRDVLEAGKLPVRKVAPLLPGGLVLHADEGFGIVLEPEQVLPPEMPQKTVIVQFAGHEKEMNPKEMVPVQWENPASTSKTDTTPIPKQPLTPPPLTWLGRLQVWQTPAPKWRNKSFPQWLLSILAKIPPEEVDQRVRIERNVVSLLLEAQKQLQGDAEQVPDNFSGDYGLLIDVAGGYQLANVTPLHHPMPQELRGSIERFEEILNRFPTVKAPGNSELGSTPAHVALIFVILAVAAVLISWLGGHAWMAVPHKHYLAMVFWASLSTLLPVAGLAAYFGGIRPPESYSYDDVQADILATLQRVQDNIRQKHWIQPSEDTLILTILDQLIRENEARIKLIYSEDANTRMVQTDYGTSGRLDFLVINAFQYMQLPPDAKEYLLLREALALRPEYKQRYKIIEPILERLIQLPEPRPPVEIYSDDVKRLNTLDAKNNLSVYLPLFEYLTHQDQQRPFNNVSDYLEYLFTRTPIAELKGDYLLMKSALIEDPADGEILDPGTFSMSIVQRSMASHQKYDDLWTMAKEEGIPSGDDTAFQSWVLEWLKNPLYSALPGELTPQAHVVERHATADPNVIPQTLFNKFGLVLWSSVHGWMGNNLDKLKNAIRESQIEDYINYIDTEEHRLTITSQTGLYEFYILVVNGGSDYQDILVEGKPDEAPVIILPQRVIPYTSFDWNDKFNDLVKEVDRQLEKLRPQYGIEPYNKPNAEPVINGSKSSPRKSKGRTRWGGAPKKGLMILGAVGLASGWGWHLLNPGSSVALSAPQTGQLLAMIIWKFPMALNGTALAVLIASSLSALVAGFASIPTQRLFSVERSKSIGAGLVREFARNKPKLISGITTEKDSYAFTLELNIPGRKTKISLEEQFLTVSAEKPGLKSWVKYGRDTTELAIKQGKDPVKIYKYPHPNPFLFFAVDQEGRFVAIVKEDFLTFYQSVVHEDPHFSELPPVDMLGDAYFITRGSGLRRLEDDPPPTNEDVSLEPWLEGLAVASWRPENEAETGVYPPELLEGEDTPLSEFMFQVSTHKKEMRKMSGVPRLQIVVTTPKSFEDRRPHLEPQTDGSMILLVPLESLPTSLDPDTHYTYLEELMKQVQPEIKKALKARRGAGNWRFMYPVYDWIADHFGPLIGYKVTPAIIESGGLWLVVREIGHYSIGNDWSTTLSGLMLLLGARGVWHFLHVFPEGTRWQDVIYIGNVLTTRNIDEMSKEPLYLTDIYTLGYLSTLFILSFPIRALDLMLVHLIVDVVFSPPSTNRMNALTKQWQRLQRILKSPAYNPAGLTDKSLIELGSLLNTFKLAGTDLVTKGVNPEDIRTLDQAIGDLETWIQNQSHQQLLYDLPTDWLSDAARENRARGLHLKIPWQILPSGARKIMTQNLTFREKYGAAVIKLFDGFPEEFFESGTGGRGGPEGGGLPNHRGAGWLERRGLQEAA